ncbi:hypothetical protein JQN63_14190 [Delftia lacustris]|uniref:hypothetical protein n=1 Tax=Delftia lacustris TaxID=558537 RepID=UPI00193BA93B|nr:hypothetical protein [Delftia lacustris]QRI92957.1 hypothetical protein JQN63_14190 [Delftia lacustris]
MHDELAALQAQVRALAEAPASASTAALQALRDDLEARLMQWEQTPRTTDVDAAIADLRNDITLLKAAQRAPIRVPTHAPAATPPIAPPAPPPVAPFPYRVLSLEQRAGFSSVSLAPATGPLRADQIQVVLPGETLGAWRLEAIEGDTVLFRNGAKSWRAALPGAQPKR